MFNELMIHKQRTSHAQGFTCHIIFPFWEIQTSYQISSTGSNTATNQLSLGQLPYDRGAVE